jgi:hypothetical protein
MGEKNRETKFGLTRTFLVERAKAMQVARDDLESERPWLSRVEDERDLAMLEARRRGADWVGVAREGEMVRPGLARLRVEAIEKVLAGMPFGKGDRR